MSSLHTRLCVHAGAHHISCAFSSCLGMETVIDAGGNVELEDELEKTIFEIYTHECALYELHQKV